MTKIENKPRWYPIIFIGLVFLLASSVVGCAPASTPAPQHIYENGAIEVGGDGEPIELINNPNATNPTYAELIAFIVANSVDTNTYFKGGPKAYVCADFAEDVHNNAEAAGIRAAWVGIVFEGKDDGHALNAFETTDRGLVYVDCTGGNVGGVERLRQILEASSGHAPSPQPTSWDNVAYVEIGKEYGHIDIVKAESLSYSFYEEYKRKWQEHERLLSDYNNEVTQYNQEIREKGLYEGSPEQARIEAWEARLKEKKQVVDELTKELEKILSEYNEEVIRFEQEIEEKVYYEGSPELAAIEAWKSRLEEKEQMIDGLTKEHERLLSDYNNEVTQYNQEIREKGLYEGSPEQARIEAWEARLEEKKQVVGELTKELGEFWSKPLGIVKDIHIHW